MRCPRCRADDTKVIDSRDAEEGSSTRRRRLCASCQHRFTTYERVEEVPLVVVKSHGGREPFDRSKVVAGITAAAKGRPVSAEQIEQLSIELEDQSRLQGNEITTAELGVEVLERLRSLDVVTYMRFASVYKNFDAAADFQRELVLLKKLQSS
jgi:transcriptional repressor NrdR